MEKHEEHANDLADDDDMRLDPDSKCAQAFENDLEKLIEDMKPKPRRDMNGFVAMMDFMKTPEVFRFVTEKVPNIDGQIEQDKTKDPLEWIVREVP